MFTIRKGISSTWRRVFQAVNLTAALCLILLAACTPAASTQLAKSAAEDNLPFIMNRGTLIIATDPDYPPQSQLNEYIPRAEDTRCETSQYTANQFSGLDVDVAVEIARRLGVEPCFVTPAWSQIIAGNWAGRWDINVGSMAITTSRMRNLYFTQPYITGQAALFVHVDNDTDMELSDLSNRRIGVCAGCAYEAYLNGTLDIPGVEITFQIEDAEVVGFDTDTSALAALAQGDGVIVDAVLTDPDTGANAIANGLPIKQLGGPVYHDYVAVSVDKNGGAESLALVERLTEIVQSMHADGTLSALSMAYYGGDFSQPAADYDIDMLNQD